MLGKSFGKSQQSANKYDLLVGSDADFALYLQNLKTAKEGEASIRLLEGLVENFQKMGTQVKEITAKVNAMHRDVGADIFAVGTQAIRDGAEMARLNAYDKDPRFAPGYLKEIANREASMLAAHKAIVEDVSFSGMRRAREATAPQLENIEKAITTFESRVRAIEEKFGFRPNPHRPQGGPGQDIK